MDDFVRLNELARERLLAHPRVAQCLNMLPKRIALLNHLALFRLGFVQQARQRRALVGALVGELRVGGRLLVCAAAAAARRRADGRRGGRRARRAVLLPLGLRRAAAAISQVLQSARGPA